jgi:hypothetical protein
MIKHTCFIERTQNRLFVTFYPFTYSYRTHVPLIRHNVIFSCDLLDLTERLSSSWMKMCLNWKLAERLSTKSHLILKSGLEWEILQSS